MIRRKLNTRTARIITMSLTVAAVVNVLIVYILSSKYIGNADQPLEQRGSALRDNHKDELGEDVRKSYPDKGDRDIKGDPKKGVAGRRERKQKTMGNIPYELAGNAMFREDELIVDPNETDWRLKRNTAISKTELTSFLKTNRKLPHSCHDKGVFVLAVVISSPYNIYRRNAIRDSWGKTTLVGNKNVHTIFVMGKHPDSWNHGGVISLDKEIKKYRDIIKGSFKLEREIRTSLKVLLSLQWVREHCRHVSYVLVVQDTMFVNFQRLVKVLKYRATQDDTDAKLWIGNVQTNQIPIHDPSSSHFISEQQYNESVYPPFCSSAAGYVMTVAATRDLYNAALTLPLFPFIDLFTGVVARNRNWTLIHNDQLFTTARVRTKTCAADRVATAVAPDNPDLMISTWKHLDNVTALRNCMDPDLDLVLPTDINNELYLEKVLKTRVDHPHICLESSRRKRDVFMVVFISSNPDNIDIRTAIRRTWGSDQVIEGKVIRLMFILGKEAHETNEMQSAIRTENARYNDIIQAEFLDSFQNHTLKVILGLKWISKNCAHAKYLYKGDEDMFVNFKSLINFLTKLRSRGEAQEKFFIGSRIFGNRRFSPENEKDAYFKKFHVSDRLYQGHYYPPYCSGSGYVLSNDMVPAMYREALRTPIISVADAFQGILAKRVGVEAVGHRGFKTWGGKVDPCALRSNDTMTVHGIGKTAKDLYQIWDAYSSDTIKCNNIWSRL